MDPPPLPLVVYDWPALSCIFLFLVPMCRCELCVCVHRIRMQNQIICDIGPLGKKLIGRGKKDDSFVDGSAVLRTPVCAG